MRSWKQRMFGIFNTNNYNYYKYYYLNIIYYKFYNCKMFLKYLYSK